MLVNLVLAPLILQLILQMFILVPLSQSTYFHLPDYHILSWIFPGYFLSWRSSRSGDQITPQMIPLPGLCIHMVVFLCPFFPSCYKIKLHGLIPQWWPSPWGVCVGGVWPGEAVLLPCYYSVRLPYLKVLLVEEVYSDNTAILLVWPSLVVCYYQITLL